MTKQEILDYITAEYADDLEMVGVKLENTQRHLFYVIDDAYHGETDRDQKRIANRQTRRLIRDRSDFVGIPAPVWPDEQPAAPAAGNILPDPIPASVVNEGQSAIPMIDGEEE